MALSESRAEIVRSLVEAAPDAAVRSLGAALRDQDEEGPLGAVKLIVDREVSERTAMTVVFAPIAPLFSTRADGIDQLSFPKSVLTALWRALKSTQEEDCRVAALMSGSSRAKDAPIPTLYDSLCRLAASGLLNRSPAFADAIRLLEAARPGALAELISCLDLTPLVRVTLVRLPEWVARMTDERAASVRVLFKDATAIAPDAGPRFIEMLFAHMSEPWAILHLMSALMPHPGDRYAADSELSDFGERLLRDIDRRLARVKAFDYDGGVAAGLAAAEQLRLATVIASEFEHSVTVDRSGPWGDRLARQKGALAAQVVAHLRKLHKAVAEALPVRPASGRGKASRPDPDVQKPLNQAALARAKALLTFFEKIRGSAAIGGYGAARNQAAEELTVWLEAYIEELLAILHGEPDLRASAKAYLDVVADLEAIFHDEQTAQLLRRRIAAAVN